MDLSLLKNIDSFISVQWTVSVLYHVVSVMTVQCRFPHSCTRSHKHPSTEDWITYAHVLSGSHYTEVVTMACSV